MKVGKGDENQQLEQDSLPLGRDRSRGTFPKTQISIRQNMNREKRRIEKKIKRKQIRQDRVRKTEKEEGKERRGQYSPAQLQNH